MSRDTDSDHSAVFLGLLTLAVLAPLPFGAVQAWAVLAIQLSALVLLAAVLLSRSGRMPWRSPLRLAMPGVILLGVGVVQCVPLPRELVGVLAPLPTAATSAAGELIPGMSRSWSSTSLVPPSTVDATLRLAAYVAIASVAIMVVRTASRLRSALTVLTGAAVFQSLYGIVEYLSGSQRIFGYQKTIGLDSASGTFINHNHFAAYLVLALPLSLALALGDHEERREGGGWRARLVALTKSGAIRRIAAVASSGIILTAIVLTYSRTGLALALLGTVVMLTFGSRSRKVAWSVGLMVLIPVVWLMWQDVSAPGERMLTIKRDIQNASGRLAVWSQACELSPGHLAFGTGLGTFESAFDTVRSAAVRLRWDHAHNEWLQGVVEFGVLPMALFGAAMWRSWRKRLRWPSGSDQSRAVAVSLVIAGMNGLVEFSLRIPGIAVLVACLVGLLLGQTHAQTAESEWCDLEERDLTNLIRIEQSTR